MTIVLHSFLLSNCYIYAFPPGNLGTWKWRTLSSDPSPSSLSTSSSSLFIYLFLAVLGLRFCARAFSSCGKRGPLFIVVQGPLFIAVRGPLTIAAPPVAGHRLQTRRLSSCGSRVQLLHGMWDPPRSGLEPVSPALAGKPSTTVPPGKPPSSSLNILSFTHLFTCSTSIS